MKIAELENKRILIAGYGIEGKATEAFVRKRVPSATIEITDASDGPDYLSQQMDYDLVIKTPGIQKKLMMAPYTTATNIFFANVDPRHTTIGVTGSKGKSTTASLIHHILSHAGKKSVLIGNIGRSMLDFVSDEPEEDTICVCELSSYQLDDIQYSPHISLIVSLFPDHVPYHGSIENYYKAKQNIIRAATDRDYYVYNPAFPPLALWSAETKAQSIAFETDFIPSKIPLMGTHNEDNVRGAITVARLLKVPDEQSGAAVSTFKPLPHRLAAVGTFAGITFYDDAISTTPESTMAALQALPNVKTIFLGGQDRGYNFMKLALYLAEKQVKHIVLFPDSGTRIEEALLSTKQGFNVFKTDSMKDAVQFAYENTPPDSVCLLSTASPSYSLWKNFEEKGDQFHEFVTHYAETKKETQ